MRFRILSIPAVVAVVASAQLAGWLAPLDDALTDARFALTGRAPSGDIAIVDVDAKTLAAVGRWPLPRRLYGDAIDRLNELGAAGIALDIDFSAASTDEDDAAMEAALARAGDAVALAAFEQPVTANGVIASNRPIRRFAEHAWLAGVNVRIDRDGKVRHLNFGMGSGPDLVPSLAALLGGGQGESGREFRIDFGIDTTRIDRISLIDLLDRKVATHRVMGKKIVVGSQAVELRDDFLVPRSGVVSGAMLQVLGAETIAAGRTLTRTNLIVTGSGLLAIALLVFFLWYCRWWTGLGVIGGAAIAVEMIAILVQRAWPVEVMTGTWHAALLFYAVLSLVREIDLRRILVAVSRSEMVNSQAMLARVIADSYAGVLVFDAAGTVIAASRTAGTILGRAGNLVGARDDILPPELAAALAETRRVAKSAKKSQKINGSRGEIAWRRGSDDVVLEYIFTPSRMEGGVDRDGNRLPDTHVVSLTFMDVTERRHADEKISHLARFDTLTGLANRNQLVERLALAHERCLAGEPSAVISLNIDRFKAVNDSLGHEVGDRLLVAIAKRLREATHPDDLVARLGGNDFVVVRSGADALARSHALAERLVASVAEPYAVDTHRLVAGISAGVAAVEEDDKDPLAVMQRADTALRRAKAGGGNTVDVFDAAMAAGVVAGQILEQELWDAFRRGEFEVFYQPVVDLASGRTVSSEALMRWRHPVRGLIAAGQFVPALEAIGLMPVVGRWVLETAATAAASWPQNVGVAVNVSSVQFMRGNLLEAVNEVLRTTGLPATRLTLEITESLFLQATHHVSTTISGLAALGIRFALDDFGTGYSSLAYLRQFPIDVIKVDRSFVVDIPTDDEAVGIVRAISVLAESLKVGVVAEGIDKEEQVRFLRLLGCTRGQGYLFGQAVPADEFAARIAAEAGGPTVASAIA